MRAESMRMTRLFQRRQVLQWRQEDIRNKMSHFRDFRAKNTDHNVTSSITNSSNAAWVTMKSESTRTDSLGGAGSINVTATNRAAIGQINMEVVQTAQTAFIRGGVQFRGIATNTENLRQAPLNDRLDRIREINTIPAAGGSIAGTIVINNVSIDVMESDTINDVMGRVNASHAGVTMSFDSMRGQFTITQNTSGAAAQIHVSGSDLGAEVLKFMGLNNLSTGSGSASSITAQGSENPTISTPVQVVDWADFVDMFGDLDPDKNFLLINNVFISLNDTNNPINTMHDLMDKINADVPGVTMDFDSVNGSFSLTGADNVTVGTFPQVIDWNEDFRDIFENATTNLGFVRINDVTINFVDFENPANNVFNMQDLMARINADVPGVTMEFDAVAERFILTGDTRITTSGCSGFGTILLNTIGLNNVSMVKPTVGEGRDAIIYLDGHSNDSNRIEIRRTSNVFEIEELGLRIDVAGASGGQRFNINTTQNVDAAVDLVRDFVENYNNLIRQLNSLHSTPRPRAGNSTRGALFEPLTDEQRQSMSERDIERWEEQARIGLLHRDSDLRNIQNQLRDLIFTPVPVTLNDGRESRMSLHQLGIQTVGINGAREDRLIGVLEINEDQLRAALEANPDAVRQVFSRNHVEANQAFERDRVETRVRMSGSDNAQRIANIPHIGVAFRIHELLHVVTESPESALRRRAGTSSGIDASENIMTRQIQEYNRRIDQMQAFLVRRENHFYSMFARMEQAMAQSHAQMDSLFAFAGSGM
jgi:flagellar capping protein FliD